MNEADQNLQNELEKDAAVTQAKANVEKAQEALAQAQANKLPYPGNGSKYKLSQWHASVNAEQSAKVMLAEAERAFRSAQNDAASARYAARLRAQEEARNTKRETAQAQHSAVEEEVARGLAEGRWLAAGGTPESFQAAWGALWQEELTRRVQAAEEQANRSAAARIRGAF